jgi:uncharacterized protein YndB with AHSA1/START domain
MTTDPAILTRWHQATDRGISGGGDERAVYLARYYDAPIEQVWDAWTAPERLARWLAPVHGDLRPGGDALLDMEPGLQVRCRILDCQPPARLAVSWSHPGEADSAVELRLAASEHGTRLELEHTRLAAGIVLNYGPGWEDFLDRLGALLGGGDPGELSWAEAEAALRPLWAAAGGRA